MTIAVGFFLSGSSFGNPRLSSPQEFTETFFSSDCRPFIPQSSFSFSCAPKSPFFSSERNSFSRKVVPSSFLTMWMLLFFLLRADQSLGSVLRAVPRSPDDSSQLFSLFFVSESESPLPPHVSLDFPCSKRVVRVFSSCGTSPFSPKFFFFFHVVRAITLSAPQRCPSFQSVGNFSFGLSTISPPFSDT